MDIGITEYGPSFGLGFPNGWRVQVTLLKTGRKLVTVLPEVQVRMDDRPTAEYMDGVEAQCIARGDHMRLDIDDFELVQFMTQVALRSPPSTRDALDMIEAVRRR